MRKLRVVTNSELGCHNTCARKHWYRYELLLRAPSNADKALTDGSESHDFQEDWWTPETVDLRYPSDPLMRALMVGYDARWSDETDWKHVSAEQEFYQPLLKVGEVQLILGLKTDGIVQYLPTGELFVREFKTSAYDVSPGSFYWQSIRLNTQIDTYNWALGEQGLNVSGTLYDVVHKPRLRPALAIAPELVKWTKPKPGTKNKPAEPSRPYANQRLEDETEAEFSARVAMAIGEEPEKFYARSVIKRTAEQIEDFEEELFYRAARMMNAPPYRNTEACIKFNRLCEYHPLCAGYGKEEDYIKQERRHSELEGTAKYETEESR